MFGVFNKLKKTGTFRTRYAGDGIIVKNRNFGFMDDPKFKAAYEWSAFYAHRGQKSPWTDVDLRWRSHVCVWAAQLALKHEGDFVECGVDTGILSGTIWKMLDFEKLDRQFFLFDTFTGTPEVAGMTESEKWFRKYHNKHRYSDTYDYITAKTAGYPNIKVVQGFLPDTLGVLAGRKIAYLSMDLNNAPSEKVVIEQLWDQLVPGAMIVLDDYAYGGFDPQYDMWNTFAKSKGLTVVSLPTSQGLLIKA